MAESILSIRNLGVHFKVPEGIVNAVTDVSIDIYSGETMGIVGESGAGKSITFLSTLGLVPSPGRITGGEVLLQGENLLSVSKRRLRQIRGKEIAIVFQDPMTSLNPVIKIGRQIYEALMAHDPNLSTSDARKRGIELLGMVGVPSPESRFDQYPHEFSGGMRQRAMIAMAIANRPQLLIADEPTTALDVTIQAQVLELLHVVQKETNSAMALITHNLGLIAELADHVTVMYGGRLVETGDVNTIFHDARHPYTLGLMACLPRLEGAAELLPIPGHPPSLINLPAGCAFRPRCELARGRERCYKERPPLYHLDGGHRSACHFHHDMAEFRKSMGKKVAMNLN